MSSALQRIEYRCEGKLHGVRKEYPNGKVYLEVRCKDNWCADRGIGEVVMHYFDIETGLLDHTRKFKDPVVKFNNGINRINRIKKESEKLGHIKKHDNLER